MSTTEKIVMYIEGQPIPEPTECFAVKGQSMIDVIHPLTGKTAIYGRTLEDVRAEKGYEQAERMTIEEFCRSKAEQQDTPITWEPVTEEKYYEMLECLPPLCWNHAGFLVNEPWDHHALTGRPRYGAYTKCGESYAASSRPITVAEWKGLTS